MTLYSEMSADAVPMSVALRRTSGHWTWGCRRWHRFSRYPICAGVGGGSLGRADDNAGEDEADGDEAGHGGEDVTSPATMPLPRMAAEPP